MINEINLKNFKSHKNTLIISNKLTLLCGQNGVGKSSLIQSLLLLRQSYIKGKLEEHLSLNKPLCNIGKTKDVLYINNDNNEIEISILNNKDNFAWNFDAGEDYDFLNRKNKNLAQVGKYLDLSLFTNNFQYISASRGANYDADDYEVLFGNQLSLNEGKAELTAQYLYEYGKSVIVNELLFHSSESDKYLLSQVTAWEREISKGVNVVPVKVGNEFDIKYTFDIPNLGPTHEFSSKNVGFGLSYALPIIVAILSAKKGSLLIIENPEAHLHPSGIAKLTELICLATQAGIQMIIETHSDHVVNGILVQCKKFEDDGKGISNSNVSIYQFDRNEDEHCTIATKIEIEEGGRIRISPKDFFDQIQNDLEQILGF
jgi:predicted ATPase